MKCRTIPLAEFIEAGRAQKVPREHLAFVCPMCGTVQSAFDLIKAGAGPDLEAVMKYEGFSCVGRWLSAGSPRRKPDGKPCNWTLGGLFQCHTVEIQTTDGKLHPRFDLATPEQAREHMKASLAAPATKEEGGS